MTTSSISSVGTVQSVQFSVTLGEIGAPVITAFVWIGLAHRRGIYDNFCSVEGVLDVLHEYTYQICLNFQINLIRRPAAVWTSVA